MLLVLNLDVDIKRYKETSTTEMKCLQRVLGVSTKDLYMNEAIKKKSGYIGTELCQETTS
uniref:Uncharacterized protein n=1 Tax=Arion vulgaris TaxID=1028688 RepID=A0A0B7BMZ9_9EUPU